MGEGGVNEREIQRFFNIFSNFMNIFNNFQQFYSNFQQFYSIFNTFSPHTRAHTRATHVQHTHVTHTRASLTRASQPTFSPFEKAYLNQIISSTSNPTQR